jgi:HD domain-containing protein
MITDVGTWSWAERTGGRLSRGDRAELIRQGIGARLGRLSARWERPLPTELPKEPDSTLAREAEERARELSSPALYRHCLRTWAFAALFAQRDQVAHDAELLYLACVLHDLGLTAAHDRRDASAQCFAVEGARAARDLLRAHGETEERARLVAEAISLHLNISVPDRLGAEASLLSKGVTLDAVGRRVRHLPAPEIAQVVERWPREGSSAALLETTKRQARIRPHSRSALLSRLGFANLVAANPLDR